MGVSKPLQDGEVTFSKLADAAVTGAKLADAAVTGAKLANAAVTGAKMSGSQSGAAPAYACRAWVNFNGTGTVAILGSGNVSSITDLGISTYRVNFSTALPTASYAAHYTTNYYDQVSIVTAQAAGSCDILSAHSSVTTVDRVINLVTFFG